MLGNVLSVVLPVATGPAPDDDFAPMLFVGVLLVLMIALVLVGIGVAMGLVAVAAGSALTGAWIVSSSAMAGLVRGQWSTGVRVALYQAAAAVGAPSGVLMLWLAAWLADVGIRTRNVIIVGLLAGAAAGLVVMFVLDKSASKVYQIVHRRWRARQLARRASGADMPEPAPRAAGE